MSQIRYSVFRVDENPHCVWEWDFHERNLEFINSINHSYFEYLAMVHFEQLKNAGDDKQLAAVALRTAYHHGLETLFSLLCATIQAPDCIFGWILKSRPSQIRKLVKKINSGRTKVFNKHKLDYVSWDAISSRIHACSNEDKERVEETTKCFADLWARFSTDYIDERNVHEYNSIKHGLRTKLGGFGLSIGIETEYGKAAPPENMHTVGHSEYGTSFFIAEQIQGSPESKKKDLHFKARRYSLNWNPENVANGLILQSMSINNILSYLKIIHGVDPSTCLFLRPQDAEDFKKPWENVVSPIYCSMDTTVTENDIRRFSKEDLCKT